VKKEKPEGAPSFPRSLREGGEVDFNVQRSSTIKPQLPTKRRGEIAEAAFLYKAASLGFSVAKPWGESDRYDFILESSGNFWRVQVKSAHTSAINGYTFHACGNVPTRIYTPLDIDFIVGYVVPHNVWYVIPIAVFSNIGAVKVFPVSRRRMSRFEKYREAWHYMGVPLDAT
jgi:hypothetical protein